MKLSRSIRLGMAYKGIKNQKALAGISDVSEATISRMTTDDYNVCISSVVKIAEALKYSVSDFIKLGEES